MLDAAVLPTEHPDTRRCCEAVAQGSVADFRPPALRLAQRPLMLGTAVLLAAGAAGAWEADRPFTVAETFHYCQTPNETEALRFIDAVTPDDGGE